MSSLVIKGFPIAGVRKVTGLMLGVVIGLSVFVSGAHQAQATAECKYYTFLDYGTDVDARKVFRSSGVRMYQRGIRAAYSPFGHVAKDGFKISSLGPFNSAQEAKGALRVQLAGLTQKGFKPHGASKLPRIFLLDKKLCN